MKRSRARRDILKQFERAHKLGITITRNAPPRKLRDDLDKIERGEMKVKEKLI